MQIYAEDSYLPDQDKRNNKYSLSTIKCVILFLIGCGGFELFGYLYTRIFLLCLGKETLAPDNTITAWWGSWINLCVYLTIAIILVTCLYFFDKDGFKVKLSAFKNKSIYQFAAYGLLINYVANIALSLLTNGIANACGITQDTSSNQTGINAMLSVNPATVIFLVTILAPIVEETTYRLGLFEPIRRYNVKLAFVLGPLIFGLIHFDFSGSISAIQENNNFNVLYNELLNLPIYISGGAILCYVYNKHLTIAESMMAHCFINAFSIIMIFISRLLPSNDTSSAMQIINLNLPLIQGYLPNLWQIIKL